MAYVVSKTKKIGGSIFVRIPKDIVEAEGIQENDAVVLNVAKLRMSGFGALKGIGSMKKHERFSDVD